MPPLKLHNRGTMTDDHDPFSTETLVQQLFERAIDPSAWPAYSVLRPDAATVREREHLSALLAASKEVKQEMLTGAGRLVGSSYQPQHRDRPGLPSSATVYAIVQPTEGASFNCSYSATAGAGFTEARVNAEAATKGRSGVDAELRLRQGGDWEGEAGISQRLPSIPVTFSYAVHGKHSPIVAGPAQRGSHLSLRHTTSLAVPLPHTAAELYSELAVPSTLSLERPHAKVAALPLGDSLGSALDSDADGAAEGSAEGVQPLTAGAAPAAAPAAAAASHSTQHHHHRHRKLTLKLRPRQAGHGLEPPATHAPTSGAALERPHHHHHSDSGPALQLQLPQQQGSQRQQQQSQQQQNKTYVPQLSADISLPHQGEGRLRAVAPRDAVLSWKQAWGPCLTSTLKWRHVQKPKPGAYTDGGGGSSSGRGAATPKVVLQSNGDSPVDSDASPSPPNSLGFSNRGSGSPAGYPHALPRQHSASSSRCSLDGAAVAAAGGAAAACGKGACEPAATTPRLQCELGCSLGKGLKALAKADLDVEALGRALPGSSGPSSIGRGLGGWAFPPPRSALQSAVKYASARVKYKLGGSGRRVVSLQSSYNGAGPCYALTWQQGRKGDSVGLPFEMEQQGRLKLDLSYQTVGQRASLNFDFFVPLG